MKNPNHLQHKTIYGLFFDKNSYQDLLLYLDENYSNFVGTSKCYDHATMFHTKSPSISNFREIQSLLGV
jgi:hypothetical protein